LPAIDQLGLADTPEAFCQAQGEAAKKWLPSHVLIVLLLRVPLATQMFLFIFYYDVSVNSKKFKQVESRAGFGIIDRRYKHVEPCQRTNLLDVLLVVRITFLTQFYNLNSN
jgi:hypothetical protein